MDTSNTRELIEQHGGFVRSLARALLRDPGQADDVAQEAWTRWVTRPPRDTSRPRGWFAAVVRGLAANTRRAEERRARHEARASERPPVPSPLEESLQAELVQRVIAAVMELEPVQRDTILSLYFRALTVGELAAESGTSEDTLRTRERRALEKLREKLDQHFGGRATWAVGLARLAQPPLAPASASAGPGSAPAATWVGVASGLALAIVGTVFWLAATQDEGGSENVPASGSGVVAEALAGTRSSLASPSPAPVVTREPGSQTSTPTRTAVAGSARGPSGASSTSLASADLAEIRGTFLLQSGEPAAHIPWSVHGWKSNEESVIAYGLPADWVDPQGETADDGSFSVRFAPPRAFQFVFGTKAPGHAQASWRWSEIAAGRVIDLGIVTLSRGATVTGQLVDSAGAPILGQEWAVVVESLGLCENEGREDVSVHAALDPVTGEFRAEDVMPGGSELEAHSPLGDAVKGPHVLAIADQTARAHIVYAGPDLKKRIAVVTPYRRLYGLILPSADHVRLVGPGGEQAANVVESNRSTFTFDDLAPGAYSVVIDDPNFRPWSQDGVEPGTLVRALLEGSSTVCVRARDAQGVPLTLDGLSVAPRSTQSTPREVRIHDGTGPFDGIVHLVPGDYTLRARSGDLEGEADVDALGSGETRTVTLCLGKRAMLRGRVVDAGGNAVSGTEVLLLRPARQDDSDTSPILPPRASTGDPELYRNQLEAVESAPDGSFAFPLGRGGSYVVHAELANGLCADTPVLSLQEGESLEGIELALPPGASVSGTVHGLESASATGLRLWIGPDLGVRRQFRRMASRDEQAHTLSADGGFAFDRLPAGTMQALLLLPEGAHPRVGGWANYWDRLEIGRFELAAGQALVRDFEGRVPGTVTIEVRVNGEAAAGAHVFVAYPYSAPGRPQFNTTLDGSGSYGPEPLFPGPWSVWASGASEPTPLEVSGGCETHLVIDVGLAEGTLRFLDAAGVALVNRSVSVFFPSAEGPPLRSAVRTTDEQGRARFSLAPGSYLLRLDGESLQANPFLAPDEVTVPLLWTAQGPQQSEIRF